MSENNSSASHSSIKPEGKPSSSFVTESSKSGELGDMPISVNAMDAGASTEYAKFTESYGSKTGEDDVQSKSATPQGKPSSSFINTSAVK